MNNQLENIADGIIIEIFASRDRKISLANEGGIVSSMAEGIQSYVSQIWDKNRPISSISAFFAPAVWWRFFTKSKFKYLAIVYEIAVALGWDDKAFWSSVGEKAKEIVKEIISSGKKATSEAIDSKIKPSMEGIVDGSFTKGSDDGELVNILKDVGITKTQSLKSAIKLKKLAIKAEQIGVDKFIKNAGILGSGILKIFRGTFAKTIGAIVSWLVRTALTGLGLVVATGAVAGALGKPNKEVSTEQSNTGPQSQETGTDPVYNLEVSKSTPREFFQIHNNDMSSIWLEHGEINNIQQILSSWVSQMYPDISTKYPNFQSSRAFSNMVGKFRVRNKLSTGLGVFAVPRPYERIADVVADLVNEILKSK